MKLIKKKKAFTLTELLVVVVVLGALAAVAVPKMSQMLETRKTTEAENVFSAVRTEQEHRCVLGKSYQTVPAKMAMLNGVKNKNYKYELTSTGITAESQGAEYTLEMPSYKTGEICCRGDACRNLNKAYQDCETLAAVADECAGTPPPPDSDPEPDPICDNSHTEGTITTGECECGGSQTETWHCGADTSYNWQKTASTSCNECSSCDNSHTEGTTTTGECECGGSQTETWHCGADTSYNWQKTASTSCNECPSCENKPTSRPSCPSDKCGSVSGDWKCDASTGYEWVDAFDYSGCTAQPDDEELPCEEGEGKQYASYVCQNNNWVLGEWEGDCGYCEDCWLACKRVGGILPNPKSFESKEAALEACKSGNSEAFYDEQVELPGDSPKCKNSGGPVSSACVGSATPSRWVIYRWKCTDSPQRCGCSLGGTDPCSCYVCVG